MKFKIGDKVEVINVRSSLRWEIGEIVEIEKDTLNLIVVGFSVWWSPSVFKESDLELVVEERG